MWPGAWSTGPCGRLGSNPDIATCFCMTGGKSFDPPPHGCIVSHKIDLFVELL